MARVKQAAVAQHEDSGQWYKEGEVSVQVEEGTDAGGSCNCLRGYLCAGQSLSTPLHRVQTPWRLIPYTKVGNAARVLINNLINVVHFYQHTFKQTKTVYNDRVFKE